ASGAEGIVFPADTTLGSMARYITTADFEHFQPMNANFGLFPKLDTRYRKKAEKNEALAQRALQSLRNFMTEERLG
ncbi:methylenetetrahydrofolate--tRNA-(uracil(54)-C(5))-methyltransferase (FADH(2)-oxidizing) TrmFO, partial [Paenibacillus macerans]|nr:methylenetetrahydrofolate--tRNA-(uracil(54)-C(5))-methyltransferase (FADH(2)-oxidizing) TrmFO [Paenibacillus macerans]